MSLAGRRFSLLLDWTPSNMNAFCAAKRARGQFLHAAERNLESTEHISSKTIFDCI